MTEHEYQICYTVNGKGYSKTEPWIWDNTIDLEKAKRGLKEAKAMFVSNYRGFEVWIEHREVGPWERLD